MEILDVVIGLVFIYVILSLVCTTVAEFVAQAVNLRGTTLISGIRTLMEGPTSASSLRRFLKPRISLPKRKPTHAEALANSQGVTDRFEAKQTPEWPAYEQAEANLAARISDAQTAGQQDAVAQARARIQDDQATEDAAAQTALGLSRACLAVSAADGVVHATRNALKRVDRKLEGELSKAEKELRGFDNPGSDREPTIEELRYYVGEAQEAVKAHAPTEWKAYQSAIQAVDAAEKAAEQLAKQETDATATARMSNAEEAARAAATAAAATATARAVSKTAALAVGRARDALIVAAPGQVETLSKAEADLARRSASATNLYRHPLITGLMTPGFFFDVRRPSYIPAGTFANTLLDLIAPADPARPRTLTAIRDTVDKLPAHLGRPLRVAVDDAGESLERFRHGIEVWFDDAMERVSGAYKRRTQVIIFAIAVAVTLVTNADSVRIWRALSSNTALREAVVKEAGTLLESPPASLNGHTNESNSLEPKPLDVSVKASDPNNQSGQPSGKPNVAGSPQSLAAATARIDSATERVERVAALGVPLGWRRIDGKLDWDSGNFVGWVITAFALSLGAPFWFDILNKVMNIRASGRAPEEHPKSPEAAPPPRGA